MNTFKEYFQHKEQVDNIEKFTEQWDSILFTGDYSPITKDEYSRISQFVVNVVDNQVYSEKFSKNVDIGVIIDHNKDNEENYLKEHMEYDLNINEKCFINENIFGLKTIPLNLNELLLMTHNRNECERDTITVISESLKDTFHNTNILIVLRPEEKMYLDDYQELTPYFKEEHLNVGFMVFESEKCILPEALRYVPVTGNILKGLSIMNYFQPEPREIKNLAHRFKVSEEINALKNLHLKFNNRYDLAFKYLFPSIKLEEDETDEAQRMNTLVIMEMLSKMFLKNAIDSNNEI